MSGGDQKSENANRQSILLLVWAGEAGCFPLMLKGLPSGTLRGQSGPQGAIARQTDIPWCQLIPLCRWATRCCWPDSGNENGCQGSLFEKSCGLQNSLLGAEQKWTELN
jgi:hypothetical protein